MGKEGRKGRESNSYYYFFEIIRHIYLYSRYSYCTIIQKGRIALKFDILCFHGCR